MTVLIATSYPLSSIPFLLIWVVCRNAATEMPFDKEPSNMGYPLTLNNIRKKARKAKSPGLLIISSYDYSMIVATAPEPTVRPPSRIAKRRPCSIATLWISSTVISTLSPGMHISVPAGSSQTPVTSVVLK